tara:strand:+ start:226 stop:615 length:390 start_codon:yes stop_codon:yes gene_type:complete
MQTFTPKQYKEQLDDISLVFTSLEQDGDTSNSTTYEENEEALTILQNNLMSDIEITLQDIDREDNVIARYDTNNENLNSRYTDIKDKIHGAIGMKNDTQTLYNHEYYGNAFIFASIAGGCLLYARTRKL